jgi:hypothetical protein
MDAQGTRAVGDWIFTPGDIVRFRGIRDHEYARNDLLIGTAIVVGLLRWPSLDLKEWGRDRVFWQSQWNVQPACPEEVAEWMLRELAR